VILVTGATGLTGGEVVRRLSALGVPVRALVRNASTTNAAKAGELARLPGVEIADGDMTRPDSPADALRVFELVAERRKGKEGTVSPVMETVFRRRPTSFEAFAGRYAAIFRGEAPAPKV
jgi:nucleoside-diphosphate-sugar epimerase